MSAVVTIIVFILIITEPVYETQRTQKASARICDPFCIMIFHGNVGPRCVSR